MRIEIDKNYIVSLKTIEEYECLLILAPWYDGTGTRDWREYPDDNSFAVKVENGEIKGFDNLNHYTEDSEGSEYKNYIFITMKDLKPLVKSFDNPEVGDVYSNENCKRTVLGVAGKVIFMSDENQDRYSTAYTKEELIKLGYKVEEKVKKEVEEITMEELIKELGREVKIKK